MLEHVCQLARNAGDAIMQVYDGIKPMEITSKQDDSPVTAADLAAHTVILEGLQALTPDIPVLSEDLIIRGILLRSKPQKKMYINLLAYRTVNHDMNIAFKTADAITVGGSPGDRV